MAGNDQDNAAYERVLKIIEQAREDGVESLDFDSEGLTQLPPEIGQLTNLTSLWLSMNKLSELPAEIGQLTNLIRLDLFGNRLGELPEAFFRLTNLIELNLSKNQLIKLPPELSRLANLHALLREEDPTHARLGLGRVPTYTGDYLWLCDRHYQDSQPKIPDKIE